MASRGDWLPTGYSVRICTNLAQLRCGSRYDRREVAGCICAALHDLARIEHHQESEGAIWRPRVGTGTKRERLADGHELERCSRAVNAKKPKNKRQTTSAFSALRFSLLALSPSPATNSPPEPLLGRFRSSCQLVPVRRLRELHLLAPSSRSSPGASGWIG
jgi:hypothetical protein